MVSLVIPRLVRGIHIVLMSAVCASAGADDWRPPEVTTRATDAGTYLADTKGMALYTYAQDNAPGKSACVKECPNVWPPLAAGPDAAPRDGWTVITRDDGTKQWAWKGKPLYGYVRDKYPGLALGDRVANAWAVAFQPLKLPPGIVVRSMFAGRTLTDSRGHTLYVNSGETTDKPACDRTCQQTWKPMAAPMAAKAVGEFTVALQPDGLKQWAHRGRRLYLNAEDPKPGIVNKAATGAWSAAVLEAAAPLPAWVTIQNSDWGEVYADDRGMTLYSFSGNMQQIRELLCGDECMSVWRTVAATAGDRASGEWTPLTSPDGKIQWAYKGDPVYVHARDREPGAVGGDKWGAGSGVGRGFMPVVVRRDYEED